MDTLEIYVRTSNCNMNECPYGEDTLCVICMRRMVTEHDAKVRADAINAIKNDLHKRITDEMNNPYQDQGLCQGLLYGIQRCDWYLDDSKEQSNTYTATVDGVKREFM